MIGTKGFEREINMTLNIASSCQIWPSEHLGKTGRNQTLAVRKTPNEGTVQDIYRTKQGRRRRRLNDARDGAKRLAVATGMALIDRQSVTRTAVMAAQYVWIYTDSTY